jgi:hypothetical protein
MYISIEVTGQQYQYIEKVCRRKDIDLKGYILDNFEWDEMPECIAVSRTRPSKRVCTGCDWEDRCPDYRGGKE